MKHPTLLKFSIIITIHFCSLMNALYVPQFDLLIFTVITKINATQILYTTI